MNDENNKSISNGPQGAPDDDLYIFEDTTSAGTPMDPIRRIISIFIAPGKLIENIKEFPRFVTAIIAILILSLISAAAAMMILPIVANSQSIAIAERYGVDFLNYTQVTEQVLSQSFGFAFIISWIGAAIGVLVAAIWGAIVIKVITLIMKGNATFKQYFSLVIHTSIITLLGGVVASLLMLMTDSAMVFTSPAPIFMPNGNFLSPLFNLLSSIEIFGIWSMLVLAIGVKKFNDGFSTGKAVAAAAVYYALSVGFAAAVTSLAMLSYDFTYNMMH